MLKLTFVAVGRRSFPFGGPSFGSFVGFKECKLSNMTLELDGIS